MRLLANWLTAERGQGLSGVRVVLRPPAMEDFEAWAALRQASRSFLEPWEPKWDDRELTRASFRERVRRITQLAQEDTAYSFLIFDHGNTILGGINLSNIRRGVAQMGALGYWIGEPHSRKGYMRDAVLTLTNHAFGELGLHRVEAACLPRNQASINLLESCRFQHEGLARGYLKIAGIWEDHMLFAKLPGDERDAG
jgi:[ribosomal protein S5]-alanine N-acetyltransferase